VAGLYLLLGFFSLQWLAPYLTYTRLIDHGAAIIEAILGSLAILLALYPAMLAVAIVTKWVVIGRFRAGEYPLWGLQYLRWWFVNSIQQSVPIDYMAGTPLLNWYYRLMGARIGANVHLGSCALAATDLVEIGDDTCIGCDTDLPAYAVEDGLLKFGPVKIGRACFIGNGSVLREGTVMEDGAKLEELSCLPRGCAVPAGERWAGSPARRVARRASWTGVPRPSLAKRFAFGVLHGLGMFVFPIMVIGAIFPGIIVMNRLNYYESSYRYLLISPFVALSFVIFLCLEIALVKWLLLGRVKAGQYDLHSGFYLRKWFVDQLMELSLDIIGPLYATVYLAPWYRLLGARLGRRAEVSTASFISPDLLSVGDEGFVADAVSLGGARVEDGKVTVAEVRIGNRAFIGNSALLPPGAVIGDNALIGCLSIPPATVPGAAKAGTAWLGSPAVFLPQRQESTAFEAAVTFKPTRKLQVERALIEFVRVILPSTCFLVLTCLLLSVFLVIHDQISIAALIAVFPLLYALFGLSAALTVIVFKWMLMGRYRAGEHPLWCPFVWRTELVTAMYENLARLFLIDKLKGTPFLAWYLRLLGAKIGKRAFLNSCELTEFDLVEIGDEAALNEGCTIQTHLFEDRVMKMSTVKIGARCTVGGQAVVLYDTEMKEGSTLDSLSLLMKGEVLPPWTHWECSPARARSARGRASSRAVAASRD
jgi:non-ribosomal peptide synthetase-like protein